MNPPRDSIARGWQSSEGESQLTKDDGDSPGPSQHDEASDDEVQGYADDEVMGYGRPMVKVLALALHRNLLVDGLIIGAFDGKRGQIIYRIRKDEQGEQQEEEKEIGEVMKELALTGPYRGISAEYGCFAIKIIVPSSGSDKHHSIEWKWYCKDPMYAAQVYGPDHHTMNAQDGSKVAEVTDAVMSDAREATVQVKFRLKDGQIASRIGGEISALIDGFEDKYRRVLFRCAKGTRRYFSPANNDDPWFLLELARNVVAVPCGRVLHIEVDLQIETEDGKEGEVKVPLRFHNPLSFNNGICLSKTDDSMEHKVDDITEVKVEITWSPDREHYSY